MIKTILRALGYPVSTNTASCIQKIAITRYYTLITNKQLLCEKRYNRITYLLTVCLKKKPFSQGLLH